MGNCGVGFAPVRPDAHESLIELMEEVEDIPGSPLADGITWGWETFAEYLDVLDSMLRVLDVGTHVPHAAVRAYVMGSRAFEDATTDELESMCAEGARRPFSMDQIGRSSFDHLYPLGDELDYEPGPDDSIGAIARCAGRDPWEVAYDVFLRDEGREFVLLSLLNCGGGSYEGLYEMMHDAGYVATVVAGEVTIERGEFTGALPGRLLRGGAHGRS